MENEYKPFIDSFILILFFSLTIVSLLIITVEFYYKNSVAKFSINKIFSHNLSSKLGIPAVIVVGTIIYFTVEKQMDGTPKDFEVQRSIASIGQLTNIHQTRYFQSQIKHLQANLSDQNFCLHTTNRNAQYNSKIHKKSLSSWKNFFTRYDLDYKEIKQLDFNNTNNCVHIFPQLKSLSLRQQSRITDLFQTKSYVFATGPIGYLNGLGSVSGNKWSIKFLDLSMNPIQDRQQSDLLEKYFPANFIQFPEKRIPNQWEPLDKRLSAINDQVTQFYMFKKIEMGKLFWTELDPQDNKNNRTTEDYYILMSLNTLLNKNVFKISLFPNNQKKVVLQKIKKVEEQPANIEKDAQYLKNLSGREYGVQISSASNSFQDLNQFKKLSFVLKKTNNFYDLILPIDKFDSRYTISNVLPESLNHRYQERTPANTYWKTDLVNLSRWIQHRSNIEMDIKQENKSYQVSLTNHSNQTIGSLTIEIDTKQIGFSGSKLALNIDGSFQVLSKIAENKWTLAVKNLKGQEQREIKLYY